MVGPPHTTALMPFLDPSEEYIASYHTTGEGRVTIQILNQGHSRIFVGFIEDAEPFVDKLKEACVRAEAIELALKGN